MDPLVGIISFVPRSDIVSFFCYFFHCVAVLPSQRARDLFPLLGKTTPVRVTISWVT